jgi:hypothetical protein
MNIYAPANDTREKTIEIFRQLSHEGRLEVLLYAGTMLKKEWDLKTFGNLDTERIGIDGAGSGRQKL